MEIHFELQKMYVFLQKKKIKNKGNRTSRNFAARKI